MAKARPWLTAKELNPLVRDALLQTTNAGMLVAQVVAMASGDEPSVAGPRYWGQSVAQAVTCPSKTRAKTVPAPCGAGFKGRGPGHTDAKA
jgi:hypothetical protein